VIDDLVSAKVATKLYQVSGVGPTIAGRNGEGDFYFTDGEIRIAVISPDAKPVNTPPENMGDSPLIALKNGAWSTVEGWLKP
jgi:hypothetical protein